MMYSKNNFIFNASIYPNSLTYIYTLSLSIDTSTALKLNTESRKYGENSRTFFTSIAFEATAFIFKGSTHKKGRTKNHH